LRFVAAITRTSVATVSLPPDALEALFLQDAQQLALRQQGEVADLVEEDGAAGALLELADALAVGRRCRPPSRGRTARSRGAFREWRRS